MTHKATLLELLRLRGWACGQEMVERGVGYRYGARIDDLRKDGDTIVKQRCYRHNHRVQMWEYQITDEGRLFG